MRLLLIAAFLAITSNAYAGSPHCSSMPLIHTTKDDGTTVGIVPTEEQRQKAPRWTIESGEPPLPLSKAISNALAWAKKQYTRFDDVRIQSIALNPYGCPGNRDEWFYVIHFSPIIEGHALFGGGHFAGVLMDGTVIGPTPVKRPF